MPSEAGWGQPCLVTKGPNQSKQHHPSSLPKMATFLGIYENFFSPLGGKLFSLPVGKGAIALVSSSQTTVDSGEVRAGILLGQQPYIHMHSEKTQLCRDIPSNSVAFSPAGFFGLINLLLKPPPAALWSQSSVTESWALFRLEPFLTPFPTQGVCQALCLSRNSLLLQRWGCHRTINKQLKLQR